MRSTWMAFTTRLFKMARLFSKSTSTGSRLDSSSNIIVHQQTGSESTFWRKCIEIFHCRRLAQLEKDLRVEREARLLLEGQVAVQRSEIERWAQMADDAIRNERTVYQTRMNVDMQQKYGFAMFPEAPMIPSDMYSEARPAQVEPDYVSMRSMQAEKTSEFLRQARDRQRTAS